MSPAYRAIQEAIKRDSPMPAFEKYIEAKSFAVNHGGVFVQLAENKRKAYEALKRADDADSGDEPRTMRELLAPDLFEAYQKEARPLQRQLAKLELQFKRRAYRLELERRQSKNKRNHAANPV